MITVLAGGVGAARFLRGLVRVVDPSSITAIVNVGDDFVLHGLAISPDIDTVRYTLAGDIGEHGWGRSHESGVVMDELATLHDVVPAGSLATNWFHLGDRDLATHLYRTQRLREGASLTDVTAELSAAAGVDVRILPISDDRVQTMIELDTGETIGFQQYFVGLQHSKPIRSVRFDGVDDATPSRSALAAIDDASCIVLAPSNPFVSIGPLLAVPGVAAAVKQRRHDAVAVSPIIGGNAVKGPAAAMLGELGHERSAAGVARLWSPFAATMVIDEVDRDLAPLVEEAGMRCVCTNTMMDDPRRAEALARVVLDVRHDVTTL